MERNVGLKHRLKGAEVHAGGLKQVDRRHHEGESDGPGVHALTAAEELIEEDKADQRDEQRVDEHQDRNRGHDDGLQTEEADEVRDHAEDHGVGLVGEVAEEPHEVRGAAGHEADRGRKAREEHDHRENRGTEVTEEDLRRTREHRSAGFKNTELRHGIRADLRDEDVDEGEERDSDRAGKQHLLHDRFRLRHAALLHKADHERREDEGRDGVKGVVAIENTLHHSGDRRRVVLRRGLGRAKRGDEGLHDEKQNNSEKRGGQDLAHTVNELRRGRREPVREEEEDEEEDRKRDIRRKRPEERLHGDLERHRAGTGSGEARSDREV